MRHADAVERVPTQFMRRFHFVLRRIETMNRLRIAALNRLRTADPTPFGGVASPVLRRPERRCEEFMERNPRRRRSIGSTALRNSTLRLLLILPWICFIELESFAFDFNGKTDILWQQRETGETAVWLMDFVRYSSVALITNDFGRGWEVAAAADFNRDGQTDLLWRNFMTGENQIALMHGTNRWARISITSGSTNFYVVGTGDFNGDGYPDILWNYRDNQRAGIWFMHEGKWTDQVAWLPNREGGDWWPVATGDFNGDSQSDIVWRNRRNGRNALWLMENPVAASLGPLLVTVME